MDKESLLLCSHCNILANEVPAEWLPGGAGKPLCIPCFRELVPNETIREFPRTPSCLVGVPCASSKGEFYLERHVLAHLQTLILQQCPPTQQHGIAAKMAKAYIHHMFEVDLPTFIKEMYPFYHLIFIAAAAQ